MGDQNLYFYIQEKDLRDLVEKKISQIIGSLIDINNNNIFKKKILIL